MWFSNQKTRITGLYDEFPRPYWTLVGVTFIDHLGGALLYPFFALYITSRFGVGMTEVGVLFGLYFISSFAGQILGGAMADRVGRRKMLIISLITTSFSSVLMGLVDSLTTFFLLALVIGVFTESGNPARQAMVADLLPEDQRADGYGIMRVSFNLSMTIGPAIGGFLAGYSYLYLFLADAVISLFAAILVWRSMPETKPARAADEPVESVGATFRGYGRVLRDTFFMLFLGVSILLGLTYVNMNTTLGVFLRDVHGVAESGYGLILSLNAAMVVLFQFPITRRIDRIPPMVVMAAGALLYGVGFGLYGFVSAYSLFLVAMVVITIGEMLIAPVAQALVARVAPEDMRGRYMAVFGFSFGIPFAIGPLLAGLIIDNADPRLLWWAAGLLGTACAVLYLGLHPRLAAETAAAPAEAGD